jgi:thiamine biosynthesis lipoprotein
VTEARAEFRCFGATCAVLVSGGDAAAAVERARRALLEAHDRFTRFDPRSELSRLNADPWPAVPVSEAMAALVRAIRDAGERSGGLVDGTLLGPLEAAGYRFDAGAPVPLELALRLAPARRPARPSAVAAWRALDVAGATVRRPPGLRIDGGGIVKGLLADRLGAQLARHDSFAVDCAGDLRVGGAAGLPRAIVVESPFDGSPLHAFELADAAIATSGIGRRSWLDARGRPAHHLLDPSTGRPAFTGLVQVTAVAPSVLEAELRAKAALLSGPDGAAAWLPDGGVVVHDDGRHAVIQSERAAGPRTAAAAAAGPSCGSAAT